MQFDSATHRKILIASANPLFSKGLQNILRQKKGEIKLEIKSTETMAGTINQLDIWRPDVVIVDYDDQAIDRKQFLSYFISRDIPLQVMLVSLKASGAVVVYDRKSLTADEVEDWLDSVSFPSSSDPANRPGGKKE